MRKSVCVFLLLLFAQAARGAAAERTFPFRTAEVNCTAHQLARVQRRMTSVGAGFITGSLGTNAVWAASGSGRFAGLVRLLDPGDNQYGDFVAGNEHFAEADLAFDLLFKPSASLLDPQKARASQATLARRDLGTSLVVDHALDNNGHGGSCCLSGEAGICSFDLSCPMVLNFDLAAVPGDSVNPLVPLVINSAAVATPELNGPLASVLSSASGAGRGIASDHLAEACGGRLTEFDTHVFEIVARTIVPATCYSLGVVECLEAYNLAIFRASDPHVYRVDIYVVQYLCDGSDCYDTSGPIALELRVNWDEQGRLTTGDVKVLPACVAGQTADCSSPQLINTFAFGIFFVPPIFPGHEEEKPAAFHGAPYLNVTSDRSQQVLHANINWKALLKTTALNQP